MLSVLLVLERWYPFDSSNERGKIFFFREPDFYISRGDNPVGAAECAFTNVAGTDKAPAAIIVMTVARFIVGIGLLRFTTAVIRCHISCFLCVSHTEFNQLLGMQAGWDQESHQQQKRDYFCEPVISCRNVFHNVRIMIV